MCGICGKFGISNNIPVLRFLAKENENRGSHAFGIFNEESIYKNNVAISKGIKTKDFFEIAKSNNCIVHTRFGTSGENTPDNAHPWQIGNIVGCHNGIVSNWKELKEKYCPAEKYEVDSQVLLHLVAFYGMEKLKEVQGYFVIVWFDLVKKSWYVLNHSGELHYCNYNGGLWVSSDRADLETVFGIVPIRKFKNNFLYTIKENNVEKLFKVKNLQSYTKFLPSYWNDDVWDNSITKKATKNYRNAPYWQNRFDGQPEKQQSLWENTSGSMQRCGEILNDNNYWEGV